MWDRVLIVFSIECMILDLDDFRNSCEISSTKWVLYVQYIPTHVPHVVFHVEMSILPYGDLHLAQALD